MLDKSKQNLAKIFEAAEAVENSYAEKFGDIVFEMGLYADRINALLSVLQPTTPIANVFIAPDFAERLGKARAELLEKEILALIADPDRLERMNITSTDAQTYMDFISDKYLSQDFLKAGIITDVERDLLLRCYEQLHPENAEKMDTFLNPIIQDGNHAEDICNIKYISYSAPEYYKTVIFACLPELIIEDYNCSPPQHYSPSNHALSVNLDLAGNGINDSSGSYFTFFHELGHGIDHAINGFNGNSSDALLGMIETDVYRIIQKEIAAQFPPKPTTEQIEQMSLILESLKNSGTTITDTSLDIIRNDVIKEFQIQLSTPSINGVASDVYGGVTNNSITDYFGHFGKNYWYDTTGNATGLQNMEFFAGNFAINVTGYQDQAKSVNTYFPTATTEMESIIKNKAGEIK